MLRNEVIVLINFKIVSSYDHQRKFYFVDGKRVDKAKYLWAESQCISFSCFRTEIDGRIIRQFKTGKL